MASGRKSRIDDPDDPRMPHHIKPMLATTGSEPFDSTEFLFEIKWDGTRTIVIAHHDGMVMHNRRLVDVRARYPEFETMAALPPGTAVDGEVVVLDDGKPSFPRLMQRQNISSDRRTSELSRRLPATFMAFDLLFHNGTNIMREPLHERKAILAELGQRLASPHFIVTDFVREHGRRYFDAASNAGLEGIMAKRLDSPYIPGRRVEAWRKIKVALIGEFEVIGFTKRHGADAVSALLIAEHGTQGLVYLGRVGTGFKEKERERMFHEFRDAPPLSGSSGRPNSLESGPDNAVWKNTGTRCKVRYFERTSAGKLRGPVFIEFLP